MTYIKAAVMMAKRPDFQLYLMIRTTRLVTDEAEALKAIRLLIDIRSRKELIKGAPPAARWGELIKQFNEWKKER